MLSTNQGYDPGGYSVAKWQVVTLVSANEDSLITVVTLQDNSDAQYRSFRNNIPVLTALIVLSLALKSLYTHVTKLGVSGPRRDNLYLIPFLVTFSVLFLLGLHGTSIIKVFIILSINYSIAKYLGPSKLSPILTWVFNGVILFANETYSGYKFAPIHPSLELLVRLLSSLPQLGLMVAVDPHHARIACRAYIHDGT